MWSTPQPEIERELTSGERLIWSGQPRGGVRFRSSDWVAIPFSLFWCGFAIFWEVMALKTTPKSTEPAAVFMPLFGVPFVLIGLYLVFGRFIVDARTRARTFYGLTDQRVIIAGGLFGRRIRSLNLRALGDVSLAERPDGSGTITFGAFPGAAPVFAPRPWPGARTYGRLAFEMIESAREVYDLIMQAQKKAS